MSDNRGLSPNTTTLAAWIRATEVWQRLVARPAAAGQGIFILHMIVFGSFYLSIHSMLANTDPVLEFEQLDKREGIVVAAWEAARGGNQYLQIRTPDGRVYTYNSAYAKRLQTLIGQPITVWSHSPLAAFGGRRDHAVQIQHDDELIIDYKRVKKNWQAWKEDQHWMVIIPFLIGVFTTICIWRIHRKPETSAAPQEISRHD